MSIGQPKEMAVIETMLLSINTGSHIRWMAYVVRYYAPRQPGKFSEKPCVPFHSPSVYAGLVCYSALWKRTEPREDSLLAQQLIFRIMFDILVLNIIALNVVRLL